MNNRISTFGRRGGIRVLLGTAIIVAALTVQAESVSSDTAVAQATAQPANGAAAMVRWPSSTPVADGYRLQTFEVAGPATPVGTVVCWSCTSAKVTGLTVGRQYRWTVAPIANGAPDATVGPEVMTNMITASPDAIPLPLLSVSAVARPDHTVEVTWQTATVGQATEWVYLWHWTSAGAPGRMMQVNADEPSKSFHVGTGGAIILGASANSSGQSVWRSSPTVDVPAGCSTAEVCVDVDSAATAVPNPLAAQGFLASTRSTDGTNVTNDAVLANALHPKAWRVGGMLYSQDAGAFGAVRSFVLSAQWSNATAGSNGGYAKAPWNDWAGFRAWVISTVTNLKASAAAPEYWDLFNEPDSLSCASTCSYFSPADRATATPANVLEMLRVEYEAVKAADPSAKIVAPSVAAYVDGVNAPPEKINMRTFLKFAAANNMKLDAVSWHENNDPIEYQDTTAQPAVVADHVQRFKRLVAHFPEVGNPAVFINEYGHPTSHLLPGWIAGFMAQLDSNPVAQANRSCWGDECGSPSMDGLLTKTGTTWQGTTPAYWTHRLYAEMDGATKMATKSSMAWRFDGTATRDDAASTVRVLVGQHWGCRKSVNWWCNNTYDPAPMTATVNVAWPYGTSMVKVEVYRIPAGITPIAGPTLVSTQSIGATNGRVAVPLSGIGDGDAYSVVLKPEYITSGNCSTYQICSSAKPIGRRNTATRS